MSHVYTDCAFTFEGKTVAQNVHVQVDRAALNDDRSSSLERISSGSMTFTVEAEVHGDWGSLLHALIPPVRGASDMTLARRIHYGGRKGRSAWRRLRAKGFIGTLVIDDMPPVPCPPIMVRTRQASEPNGKD